MVAQAAHGVEVAARRAARRIGQGASVIGRTVGDVPAALTGNDRRGGPLHWPPSHPPRDRGAAFHHHRDRLAVVRLARPAARNALSLGAMRELTQQAARGFAERTDIDAVILTGDDACFSAGVDLRTPSAGPTPGCRSSSGARSLRSATACARSGGVAAGHAGRDRRLCGGRRPGAGPGCDWRIMADDAFVSLPRSRSASPSPGARSRAWWRSSARRAPSGA